MQSHFKKENEVVLSYRWHFQDGRSKGMGTEWDKEVVGKVGPEGLYGYQHLLSKPTHNLFWKSCQAPGTLGAHTASSNKIIPRTDMTTWKQQDSATAPIRIRQHPAQCPVLRLFPRLSQILQRERRSCYLRDCLIQGSPPLCGSLGT